MNSQSKTDPTPALLVQIAAAIKADAPKVLRGRASVVTRSPVLRSWAPDDLASAHVWHSDRGDGIDIWCVLEAADIRSLLPVVLQGPAGDEPTPLERNIARDTVERLLVATGRVWEQRAASQLPPAVGWCCQSILSDALGTEAALSLLSPSSEPQEESSTRVDLRNIPVQLEALTPTIELRVDAIARWRAGDVVTLATCQEATVSMRIGTIPVANASLGSTHGRRAVLITGRSDG